MSVADMVDTSPLKTRPVEPTFMDTLKAYVALTKPRIAVMLVFTAAAAMVVAAGGVPEWRHALLGLIGLVLSAGGSAAVNMWYDRDIDAVMSRTSRRPLPTGVIAPGRALAFGLALGLASVLLLGFGVNWLTAGLCLAGYVYYAWFYTMVLKRHTPQNIVVGGGAGSFPPLVGWAAVTGHVSLTAWLMFAVIFLWTPPHFWALALYKNADYQRAGVPMLPVSHGSRATKRQMSVYAVLLLAASLALLPSVHAQLIYATVAVIQGGAFLVINLRLLAAPDEEMKWAKRTFFASLLYVPAIFLAIVLCQF